MYGSADIRCCVAVLVNYPPPVCLAKDAHGFRQPIRDDSVRRDDGYLDSVCKADPRPRVDDVRVALAADLDELLNIAGCGDRTIR